MLTGVLDALRAGEARDGGDGFLPPLGQGDAAGRRGARAGGDRTGARPRGSSRGSPRPGGSIELGVHENQVVFATGDALLTTRRIDGQFPNYNQLIPETFDHEIALPRDELLEVVRRVAVMAQRNSPLRLRFADGELTVSAQTQDVGEARESLPVAFSGEPLEIGFNAEFLRDGVESVVGEQARLKLISPLRPGLIQGESDDFLYLIMPIRLAG